MGWEGEWETPVKSVLKGKEYRESVLRGSPGFQVWGFLLFITLRREGRESEFPQDSTLTKFHSF